MTEKQRIKTKTRVLFALLASRCSAEVPQVNNAFPCNEENDPMEQEDCRKSRAANMYCHDRTRCQLGDLSTRPEMHPRTGRVIEAYFCPDDQAAKRIGMTCDTFPFYNGGYPILAGGLDWDSEWEDYFCTLTSDDDRFCTRWWSHEDSPGEFEIGNHTCNSVGRTASGNTYCQTWSSVQIEREKCRGHYDCFPDCEWPAYCYKRCCKDYSCWNCSYATHSEYEYSEGTCTAVNDFGACLAWTQEEYNMAYTNSREYENYTCLELSDNQAYCRRWFGSIDSQEEFELSSCECIDDDSANKTYCQRWICYETGYSYFYPNIAWVFLPITIGAFFIFGFRAGVADNANEDYKLPSDIRILCGVVYAVVVVIGLNIAVAYLAGFMGLLIAIGTTCILYPAILCCWQWHLRLHAAAAAQVGQPNPSVNPAVKQDVKPSVNPEWMTTAPEYNDQAV